MNLEKLEIRNFGPIKNISLDLKKINVFIGPQGTGKSSISKLICIFRDPLFWANKSDNNTFHKYLADYNISNFLGSKTEIKYNTKYCKFNFKEDKIIEYNFNKSFNEEVNNLEIKLKKTYDLQDGFKPQDLFDAIDKNKIDYLNLLTKSLNLGEKKIKPLDKNVKEELKKYQEHYELGQKFIHLIDNFQKDSIYIPAERILISMISNISFQLQSNEIALPKYIVDFGAKFEQSRKKTNDTKIDILDISYKFDENKDFVVLNNKKKISLKEVSSGIQSIIPLYMVFEQYSTYKDKENTFVVEEPELHLFPDNQEKLIKYLVKKIYAANDELIITTHSPYVLSTLNKLLYAFQVGNLPQKNSKTKKIIPEEYWIDNSEISCFFIKSGEAVNLIDSETGLISENELDEISNSISKEFNELVDIQLDY